LSVGSGYVGSTDGSGPEIAVVGAGCVFGAGDVVGAGAGCDFGAGDVVGAGAGCDFGAGAVVGAGAGAVAGAGDPLGCGDVEDPGAGAGGRGVSDGVSVMAITLICGTFTESTVDDGVVASTDDGVTRVVLHSEEFTEGAVKICTKIKSFSRASLMSYSTPLTMKFSMLISVMTAVVSLLWRKIVSWDFSSEKTTNERMVELELASEETTVGSIFDVRKAMACPAQLKELSNRIRL